jgi:hypothetical protein
MPASSSSGITIFENIDSAESFVQQPPVSTGHSQFRNIELGDMDGDGDLDIVYSAIYGGRGMAWLENEGHSARFTTAHDIGYSYSDPSELALADMDGDGDLDVVATYMLSGEVSWFENRNREGYSWAENRVTLSYLYPTMVDAGDLDGDGDVEIVVTTKNGWNWGARWYEQLNATDAVDPDSDDDGLMDGDEVHVHHTDPLDDDSDDDGFTDGAEIAAGSDPLDAASVPPPAPAPTPTPPPVDPAVPVPALGGVATGLLSVLLAAAGGVGLRGRRFTGRS